MDFEKSINSFGIKKMIDHLIIYRTIFFYNSLMIFTDNEIPFFEIKSKP